MSLSHLFLAALLGLPVLVVAEAQADQAHAATDGVAGPAVTADSESSFRYESAFAGYRRFSDPDQSPDKGWRDANRTVGELGGHAGQMQPMPHASHATRTTHAAPAASSSGIPAVAPQGPAASTRSGSRGHDGAHH